MTHWTDGLVGSGPGETGLAWLGPEEDRVRADLGDGAVVWAAEVGKRITDRVVSEIPGLRGLTPALLRATTSTTMQALLLVSGRVDAVEPSLSSTEEIAISRDFARRGLALEDLLQSFRVGYAVLCAALLDAATDGTPGSELASELRRISVLMLEMMDGFTRDSASAYIDEQNTWTASIAAARHEAVSRIIGGDEVDADAVADLLGYALDGPHIAVIAWSAASSAPSSRTTDLRSVIEPVLRRWGAPTATLLVPVGAHAVWAWGTVQPTASARRDPLPVCPGTHLAVGTPGRGPTGFRRSHFEARAVERMVRLVPDSAPATTAHEDVDLELLLLADPAAARAFVARRLGPLGDDDPRMAELRCTLGLYLDLNRSISGVAVAEHIARNTVTYRVRQAFALCGHAPDDATTALRAALMIRDRMGFPP